MIPRSIGNYNLERELDRGGVAAVFLAKHRWLNRQVAIKVLLNQAEDHLQRFKREAELTSQLQHPHIVEIFDHGMQGPYAFTVMEAAMGGSLRNKLEAAPDHRLSTEDALRIFRQIGEALDFAHSKGTIHRDVTPGNILLDGSGQRALLTDFGIARSEKQQGLTATRMIMGTPGFFSPEHLRSAREVTAQSDVFALGLVLYTMLAGQMPWDTIPDAAADLFAPPKPLSQLINIHPGIDPIIMTLLAVDPKHRFGSVHDALEELRRIFPNLAVLRSGEEVGATSKGAMFYVTPDFEAIGVQRNDVEQALGSHLERQIIDKAHRRAEALRRPETLVGVLEEWSREARFRRRNLGRLATFQSVESRNIYFYQLDVLLETRLEPFVWEQPDRSRQPMSGTREIGVWDMKLPEPNTFDESEGTVNEITGSEQVSHCSMCSGKSNILCETCKGNGRITVTHTVERPVDVRNEQGQKSQATMTAVENTVKPCPDCMGKGFQRCTTCEGIGMVIRRKGFKWTRQPVQMVGRDDLADIDESALEIEAQEVYNQTFPTIPAEWRKVHALNTLLQSVEDQIDSRTRIVMARARIRMVPVTIVEFELGRRTLAQSNLVAMIDHDQDPSTPAVMHVRQQFDDDESGEGKRLHLLGFSNTVSAKEALNFRDWERILFISAVAFFATLFLIALIFIVFVY